MWRVTKRSVDGKSRFCQATEKEGAQYMSIETLLVFASGGKNPEDGGSGFQKLVEASRTGIIDGTIVGVVSNHVQGGVYMRAKELGIQFFHSPKGRTANDYHNIISASHAKWVALSGWLGHIEGHDPAKTFNIHPAFDLDRFGGKGMHGRHVHEAVWEAFLKEEITHTGITMHFVTARYDDPGAVFFKRSLPITKSFRNARVLGQAVNLLEHAWQAKITNRVIHGEISWNGQNPASIRGTDIE